VIYSVWNQSAKLYDYFETSEPSSTVNAPQPKHLSRTKLGMTPTQASWPLPASARRTGRGSLARGRVAHPRGGAMAGFDVDTNTVKIGLLLVVAVVLWRKWR
jgi:hypothetical protein